MANVDDSIQNLEQFIGELTAATGALGQVTDHVGASTRDLAGLETEAAEHGGGLNDDLEGFATQLDSAEAEGVQAVEEVAQAANNGHDTLEAVRTQVEHAADDVETRVQAVRSGLDEADHELTAQGFTVLSHAADEAESALEAERQDAQQAFTEMADAMHGFETEAQGVWDAADHAAEEAVADAKGQETSLETEATASVHAFEAAGGDFGGACSALEAELGAIYDSCVAGIDAEAEELEHGAEGLVQEAVAFVDRGAHQGLEAPADLVEHKALGALHEEYASLGHCLEAAHDVAGSLDPLAGELEKSRTVVEQVDQLMKALAG
jgi:hypothetical protein